MECFYFVTINHYNPAAAHAKQEQGLDKHGLWLINGTKRGSATQEIDPANRRMDGYNEEITDGKG